MLLVGVTGGIGSGKTVICSIFEHLGIAVYNADERAKKILTNSAPVKAKVIEKFGSGVYLPDGNLNRDYLAGIVFNNTLSLQKLNAIVHPAVRESFKSWCADNANYPYLIEEAAILIESGAYKDLDVIITVNVDMEARISRVMERDNYSREQVELRLKRQMSDVERAQHADYIIGNNENELVIPQVLKIHEDLIRKANSRS